MHIQENDYSSSAVASSTKHLRSKKHNFVNESSFINLRSPSPIEFKLPQSSSRMQQLTSRSQSHAYCCANRSPLRQSISGHSSLMMVNRGQNMEEINRLRDEMVHMTDSLKQARRCKEDQQVQIGRQVNQLKGKIEGIRDRIEGDKENKIKQRVEQKYQGTPLNSQQQNTIKNYSSEKQPKSPQKKYIDNQLKEEEERIEKRIQNNAMQKADYEKDKKERDAKIMEMVRLRATHLDQEQPLPRVKSSNLYNTHAASTTQLARQLQTEWTARESVQQPQYIGFHSLFMGLNKQ
ncbi:hypothetical protein FGO68_gene17357 [Halteria grandinella]|uniref:Uncharacterized protein n=1 Tax=Halteria grandinella TaxID=5974 RepID=A0A8J8NA91_HALGN|nr:hypothetical protein FGO68_gene17357 [Halteria grandinella]